MPSEGCEAPPVSAPDDLDLPDLDDEIDVRSSHPTCEFCGEPNEELSWGNGKTGWGCNNDHSGVS